MTLALAAQLYWRQQASIRMRETPTVHSLPAPRPLEGLTYQSDLRLDEAERSRSGTQPGQAPDGDAAGGTSSGEAIPEATRLSLAVVPSDVTTFVYLNGGSLLGRAPLRDLPVPPGQHRLTLWAPSIRGRAVRTVNLAPGEHAVVMTALAAVPMAETSLVR